MIKDEVGYISEIFKEFEDLARDLEKYIQGCVFNRIIIKSSMLECSPVKLCSNVPK